MFDKRIDFNNVDPSWRLETFPASSTLEIVDGHAVCTAGGEPAETHYARVKQAGLTIRDELFTVEAEVYLPADFYTRQIDYFRLIGVDNYTLNIAGVWRIGFVVFSNHLPYIYCEHRGYYEGQLWAGAERLPLGLHKYALVVRASEIEPLTELWIDGARVVSTMDVNVPPTLAYKEQSLTRQTVGVDGASGYNESSLSLEVHSVRIYSGSPTPGESCLKKVFEVIVPKS